MMSELSYLPGVNSHREILKKNTHTDEYIREATSKLESGEGFWAWFRGSNVLGLMAIERNPSKSETSHFFLRSFSKGRAEHLEDRIVMIRQVEAW